MDHERTPSRLDRAEAGFRGATRLGWLLTALVTVTVVLAIVHPALAVLWLVAYGIYRWRVRGAAVALALFLVLTPLPGDVAAAHTSTYCGTAWRYELGPLGATHWYVQYHSTFWSGGRRYRRYQHYEAVYSYPLWTHYVYRHIRARQC